MMWAGSGAAHAQTVDIPAQGLAGITSLTQAVNLAQDGAVLEMSAGDFVEAATVAIEKALTIRGAGQGVTTLTAANGFQVIELRNADLTLEDLAIVSTPANQRGVTAAEGSSSLTIRSTSFATKVNVASDGGALRVIDPTLLVLENVTFIGEQGSARARDGGAIYVSSTDGAAVTLTDVLFDGVEADGDGGGIYAQGVDLTCSGCAFIDTEGSNGGGVYADGGTLRVERSTFCGSDAPSGSGVYGTGTAATVVNSVFADTPAGDVPAVYAASGTWLVANNDFFGNTGSGVRHAAGVPVEISSNVFLQNEGFGIDADAPDATYNWFEANLAGAASDLPLDPSNYIDLAHDVDLFVGGDQISCEDPTTLFLPVGSPLVDAGRPAYADPDGSRSDVGASGGPSADPAAHADNDSDGYSYLQDCDDSSAAVLPNAQELCDGIDNDCDDLLDDADPGVTGRVWYYADCDHDGQGDVTNARLTCSVPTEDLCGTGETVWIAADAGPFAASDCDDTDPAVFASSWLPDEDGDGSADLRSDPVVSCDAPFVGWLAADGTDCDDGAPAVHPGAEELCNGIDDDCDDAVDEDVSGRCKSGTDRRCGCASSGLDGLAPALLLALVPLLRRRPTC